MKQTISDYATDPNLSFGIMPTNAAETEHRAADIGGSEITFRCPPEVAAKITKQLERDGEELPGEDDSDENLVAFWAEVEATIKRTGATIIKS